MFLCRNPDLTPEERDMRTVFCMQLSQRVRARDLEEFFSPVGKVIMLKACSNYLSIYLHMHIFFVFP